MALKNVASIALFYVQDVSTGLGVSGLTSGNFSSIKLAQDNIISAELNISGIITISGYGGGYYAFPTTAAMMNYGCIVPIILSSGNYQPYGFPIYTEQGYLATTSGTVATINNTLTTVSGNVSNLPNIATIVSSGNANNWNAVTAVTDISGQLVTIQSNLSTVSGDLNTLRNNFSATSGDITTVKNNITTISGNLNSTSGDINTLRTNFTTVSGYITNALPAFAPNSSGGLQLLDGFLQPTIRRGVIGAYTNGASFALDAGASSVNDFYTGATIVIVGPSNSGYIGQTRFIKTYNGTTKYVTVDSVVTSLVANTSQYIIVPTYTYINNSPTGYVQYVNSLAATGLNQIIASGNANGWNTSVYNSGLLNTISSNLNTVSNTLNNLPNINTIVSSGNVAGWNNVTSPIDLTGISGTLNNINTTLNIISGNTNSIPSINTIVASGNASNWNSVTTVDLTSISGSLDTISGNLKRTENTIITISGNMNNIPIIDVSSDITSIKNTVQSATYGNNALLTAVQNVQNNTFIAATIPTMLERPDAGFVVVSVSVVFSDETGTAKNLDSGNPIVILANDLGADLSSRLGSWSHPAVGKYVISYTNSSTDNLEGLHWEITGTINGKLRRYPGYMQLVDTTAVDFTSADRAMLTQVQQNLVAVSGDVNSSNGLLNSLSGQINLNNSIISTVSGNINIIDNTLNTISGNLNTGVQIIDISSNALSQIVASGNAANWAADTINVTVSGVTSQVLASIANSVLETQLPELITDPGATPTLREAEMLKYMQLRNVTIQEDPILAGKHSYIYNDAGSGVFKSSIFDDPTSGIFIKGKIELI